MPTATSEVETTPKPLAPSGARQRLQEVAGAMDEFFQSDDWKTADSPTRQQHLDRITGVFDEEYSRAAPDLNPDEADQLFNSGVSFLKGRLAESGDAPPLDAFPSEGAMKAADALRQTRNDANAPEPNAEDYGKYGLEAIQLKRSSAQERYPKERLDFIKKTGLRPEHVDRLMDDREALERLNDKAVVMKTTGDVAVPPQKAMDEAEWNSAVDATNATPEKKAKAKAHRLKVRDQLAGKIEFSLAAVDPEWEKWSAGMAGEMKDASIGEKVERFIKWRKASGAKMSAIDRAVDQNAASFVKQFFGLIGGITNIGKMKEVAATAGEIEQANAQIRSVVGGAGATGFAVDLFGGLAPTIAFSPLARLATTNLGAMRLMAGIGAAQGYGGKYADASAAYSEQGLSDKDAHMKAQLPALVSALTTYALARMMPRGVESIGQINSAKTAAKTAYRKFGGELLADVGDETIEEAAQATVDEVVARFTYDPKKDMRSALENIFMSGLMGGIGGGVVGAVSRYANKVKPILETADQMRAAGYPMAAAETEKTAEIEATKQYWAEVAKAQKRAVEHTQANEGPQTERAAYGRTGDVYDAFGNVQRKAGGFLGLPDAGNPEGTPKAVGDANYKPEPAKESEPKNEEAKSVPSVQKADEPVRLPQKEVAPAAPSPEPVTPVAAKPVEQPTPAPKDTTERIQEAAYRDASGKIYKTGAFHDSSKLPKKFQADNENARGVEPGWLTSSGRFVGREEGFAIAAASKQVKDSYKAEWPNVLGHFNVKPETLGKQSTPAQIEQAIADANWLGTVREVPAPRSMGGEGVKLYIPVDASGKDVSVGGQTILGKTPAEAIELAQKNTKPAPTPQAPAPDAAPTKAEEDYRMQHRPNSDGPQAHDLLSTDLAPRDIYDRPDYYTGEPKSKGFRESIAAIRRIRGNPDAEVTIYRASPQNTLNEGDWVSFSETYSKQHGMADDPSADVPVHAFKVKARDVRWAGDTLEEFGYYPEKPTPAAAAPLLPRPIIKALLRSGHEIVPSGPQQAGFRSLVMEKIGKPVPKSKAGVTAVTKALAEYLGVDMNDTIAGVESKMRAKLNDMLDTHEAPTPAPAPTGAKTRLDLMLDGVERTGKELTIEVTDANRDNLTKIIETAEKRGLRASTDGRFVLIRPAEPRSKDAIETIFFGGRSGITEITGQPNGQHFTTDSKTASNYARMRGQGTSGSVYKAEIPKDKIQYLGENNPQAWLVEVDPKNPADVQKYGIVDFDSSGRLFAFTNNAPKRSDGIIGVGIPKEYFKETALNEKASPAVPQAEGGIFGYSWADIRSKQQGGTLAALIRGNAVKPKATESDFAVLEKHGMDWLYDNEKFGIIDRLGLPVERPSKKAVEAKATEGQFSIYQMERKDGMKWMVQSGEKRGFGDGIFDTKAEAEKYAATEKTRQQERAAAVEREAQKNRDEEAAKELRERDVNDFTAAIGATPLAAGKLKKTLMEQVAKRTAGKVYEGTRAQVAKQLLAAGFKPTSEQVDAVKDLTGTQMNRMDNKEQAAYEKRKREAGKKTEYRLENSEGNLFEVTKAEHDYAKWLESEQVKASPAPTPVTEAAKLRAKIVKGATVEVSLVRGSKLTHRAKVQDVDTQNGVVTVTFKKGKKFNGGETQTVRLDQVAPLASVQTRMLNEVQFEGMTEDQKRQTKADAKEFDRLVRDHPEMGWYEWRVDDLAGTKSGDMDIAAERKRASMEAMEALGGDPTWNPKGNSVIKAELLPKLKAAIEEKAHELAREAPDSALSDDTDLLPQGESPEPAPTALVAAKPETPTINVLKYNDSTKITGTADGGLYATVRTIKRKSGQMAYEVKGYGKAEGQHPDLEQTYEARGEQEAIDAAKGIARREIAKQTPEPAAPKLRPSDGKGTGELLQGEAAPFNLVAETAADIAKREARESAEQVAKEAKDAADAKAKFDKEQGNLFDEDPFTIADAAPATSLPVASVQRAVRVVAERLAGAMPHEVIADGSQYPDRVKESAKERGITDLNLIRGVVVNGKIWINAAAIENPRQAIETFMHEAAGHGGVDALLQAFGGKATTQLDAMLKRLFPDDYAAVQRRYEPHEQVSETLARIMQRVGPEMSAQTRTRWQRVVDWLRNALNKLGVKQWSTNDVMALLRRGVDAVRKSAVAKKSTDVSALVGNELTYAAREAGVMLTPEQTMRVINRDPAVTADVQARVSDARGEGAKMSVVERDSENMEELPLSNFDRSSENDGYLYHVTTKDRVDAVVYEGEGLKAGADGQFQGAAARNNSKGRIFLTERSGVATWAHEIEQQLFHSRDYSEEQDPRDDLTVVRVPRNLVDGLRDDFAEKPAVKGRDYYTEKPIPASPVEPKFSLKDSRITPDQDREYLAAVKRGDMETAQRMLKDAAVKKFGAPFVESESVQTQRIYVTKNANKQIAYSRERIANLPTDEQVKEQYLADRKAWELAVSDPDNATVDETIEAIHRGIKPVNYTVEDALRSRDMEREGAEKEIRIAQAWKDRTPEGPEQTHFQTGKPFVTKAYHATPFGRLETFDDGMLGAFTGAPSAKLAHFFAGSQKVAESYFVDSSWLLQQKGFLKLSGEQKTELVSAVREELGSNPSADEVANIAEEITGETYDPSPIENELHEVFVHLKNPLVHDFQGDGYRDTSYRELLEKAEKEGHDGVVLANTYDAGPAALMDDHGPSTNVIAVLRGHSSQIKSAESSSVPLSERFNPESSDIRFSLKDENPKATSTTKRAVMDKEREVAMLQGSADKLLQDIRKSGRPPTVEEMQQIAAIDSLIAKRQAEIQAEASNVAQGATPPEINIADLNAEPPDREETGESGPRTYGGKFDSMDAQRAERGLPPLARRFRKANRVLWDAAVKRFETEPKWADRLVDEISSGEKTVLTDEEFAGVFAQQIDLHNKRQEAADRARDPNLSEEEQRDALDQFQYYEKKLQASEILKGMAGSEAGAALQSLKLMANEDFSLAAMEARERKAKQSGLTPEEVDRIRDEATRIAKAQADLDARKAATEAAERIANAEAKIAEWSKIPSRVLEYAKQKVNEWVSAGNAASERLRARAGQVNVGVDPMILGDIFLFARGKIAQGMESFGNFAASTASEFGEWVRPYLKPAWDKAMKYLNTNQPGRKVSDKQKARQQAATEDAASIEDGIRAMAEEGLPDDMGRYVKRLANAYVKSGATTVKGVMARLHAFLDPVMGNPTDDVLLDLWTDYGGGKAATEDALKRLQSQIRQEALIVRQIIDAEAALVRSQAGEDVGDYLKLTGQQRVPVRDQARALAQQLNELKKKIPPPQSTAESRRQSALDALEKRTRNRIKDLRFEIAKGERTIKNRGVTPTSPNLEALRAELATVEAEHLAVFGRREATPEQKLKSAIKSAERAEQKALAELEAAKRGVFTRPVQKGAETRNEVLVIRARADAARAETQALKELANPPLSDAQKRLDAALVARERWEQMLAGEQKPTSRQPQESLTQLEEDARMEIAAMRELAAQIRRDAKPATDPDDAKVRALEAAAAEYERRVNESDFTAKSKTTTADSARVAQARALRDAALAAYNAAKNAAGVTEQTKIANRKAAMLRQIADLTDRLAKSDFEKRPPRPPVDLSKDSEAVRIASDLQEIKSNYAKRLLHYIKERRGGYEKFTDAMWTAITAERSLMGSGDLSATRQGIRMAYSHPIMAAKAMWRSIRTIFSQKQAVSYEAERKLRPNYALYKPMKIQMPSVEAEAHDRMSEEGVRSNIEDWADIKLSGNPLLVLPKLVPKLLGHYVRASSRTFTTFLNELAADVADYRINELRDKPMSKIEKEALGDMINSARGRGLKAGAGKLAQFVFYSANFLAARAKNLSGYHVWRRNSSARIRKIALKEQFRAIAGWMVVSAISRYFYGDTGDDEDMLDKAKRLFKLRVTDSDARMEYDYTGGEAKLVRLGAALIEGISTTIQAMLSGQEEADKQRAFTSYATIGREIRSISAPWMGVAADLYTGSNYDGKVPTVPSIARDLTVPLAWRSADEFFERAGFAKTVGAKLQEAIGVGVSVTRDKTAPKERRYSR